MADASGVSLPDKNLKFSGDIYSAKQNGKSVIVETQMRISPPDGRALEENVAGISDDPQRAFGESLYNLCTSTLESLYVEFVDGNDDYVMRSQASFGGKARTIYQTGWSRRGDQPADDKSMQNLMAQVFTRMGSLKLDAQAHWGKLVLLSANGKIKTVDLIIDNQEQPTEAESIKSINWPKTEKFYMLKLFFVVHAGMP